MEKIAWRCNFFLLQLGYLNYGAALDEEMTQQTHYQGHVENYYGREKLVANALLGGDL